MRSIILVCAALMLAACSSEPAATASPSASSSAHDVVIVTATPTPVPPDDAIVVTGTSACETVDEVGPEPIGDTAGYVMTSGFRCEATASDPRVTGREEMTLVARIVDPALGGACTMDDAVLTSADGTWSGTGRCMVDLAGILSPAQYVEPWYFGEVLFVGGGAYEGLHYRCFLSGMQGELAHAGWIAEEG